MLDTDIPAVSIRPRPATAARRSPAVSRPAASVSPRSAPKPGRLARSEMRLLAFAVAATVIVCGLLVLYLAAYARVSRLGLDLSKHRVELSGLRQQNQLLEAQVASLQSPQRIAAAAQKQKMIFNTSRTDYLAPRPSESALPVSLSSGETSQASDNGQEERSRDPRLMANIQVTNRGEKNNNSKTASSNH